MQRERGTTDRRLAATVCRPRAKSRQLDIEPDDDRRCHFSHAEIGALMFLASVIHQVLVDGAQDLPKVTVEIISTVLAAVDPF